MTPAADIPMRLDGQAVAIELPADFAGFDGHFPGDPVLPGMCQIELAVRAIRLLLGRPRLELREVRRARFLRPVHPGEEFRIEMRHAAEGPLVILRTTHLADGVLAGHAVIALGERG